MKARNLLIISPKTYNYHKLILKASQGLGFNSIWIEDRPYESLMFKIVSRYFNYFARLISIGFYKKCLDHFTANNIYFDTLIVVKGESVHPKVIEHIKLKFPKIRMIFYYWDSVKNVPNPFLITRYFEKCATFDIHDSENRCWDYIPLFAGNFSKNIKTKSRTKKLISFVGVFHSDRLKIIGDLISSYGKAKYSIKNQNIINLDKETDLFLYLYFPSIFHKIKALFKNPIY